MAPLIKYFIVFYLCSYNGCLAEVERCENQINELFKMCDLCKSENAITRVKSYLEFILLHIDVTKIQTKQFAHPFVINIVLMLFMKDDKPESPEKFCDEMYTEDKGLCAKGLQKIFGPEYGNGRSCMKNTFLYLSIALFNEKFKRFAAPLIAYMEHVKSYIDVDTSVFTSGTTPQRYCWIELIENYPAEVSSNKDQPEENKTRHAIFKLDQLIGPNHIQPNNLEEGSGQSWVDKKRRGGQSSASKKRPGSGDEPFTSKKVKPSQEATKAEESQK